MTSIPVHRACTNKLTSSMFDECDLACDNRPSEYKKIAKFLSLLYHSLIIIYTTTTKSSSLLQNLMGFKLSNCLNLDHTKEIQTTKVCVYIYIYIVLPHIMARAFIFSSNFLPRPLNETGNYTKPACIS